MRKFFKLFHKWLAIPVGLIISVTCLTGAILVFQDEILELSNPSHYFVEKVKEEKIPLHELIPIVNKQLDSTVVASVKISADPQRTYTMVLKDGFRISVFVDPYTGQIKGQYSARESFFWTVMSLHRWMLDDSRTWGKYAVGISTMLFAFILVSGIIIWIPRSKKQIKKSLSIKLRSGRKRLFYDMHNVLGAYACLVLLICALTGLMWSFEWYRNGVFSLFGAEQTTEASHHGRNQREKGEKKEELNISTWQPVFNRVAAINPHYEYIRIQDGKADVHLKSAPTSRANDSYVFDKKTGEIKKINFYKDQAKTSKIWGWVYALHVGNYWGMTSKVFTCVFALIGASLPITGYYLYFIKKKRKKKKPKELIKKEN